ncbi:hypothetical protein [Iamia sp.]|uniref:hypothetical protein n=1 Tax=Iamia sp. TaxID=2722710 RepID=UPI002D122AF3|nr:hypothetical protein [Iamia sp.]HXH57382.1 hypothetical protein [Iamia sp.]
MPKTLQIRDVPDDQYRVLAERAARAGTTVPELLRREIERITERPSMEEWLERTRGRRSTITTEQVLDALDEIRGPWPGDDR